MNARHSLCGAGLLLTLVAIGCSKPIASSPAAKTLTLIAVDNSGSTDSMRKQLVSMAYDVATDLNASTDEFKAYAFAGDIREVTSEVPTDEDAFAATLSKAVMPTSKDHGTDYSKVLARLADVSASNPAHAIRLFIAGDGLTDFESAEVNRRFEQAGKDLAANPRITTILIYGAETGARERFERYLKGGSYQLHFVDLGQNLPPLP